MTLYESSEKKTPLWKLRKAEGKGEMQRNMLSGNLKRTVGVKDKDHRGKSFQELTTKLTVDNCGTSWFVEW